MDAIYIAGKVTGEPKYQEKFDKAAKRLQKLYPDHTIINPTVMPETLNWEQAMIIAMAMLSVCNKIYMLPDWEKSMGAKQEFLYARDNDYEIIYEGECLDEINV